MTEQESSLMYNPEKYILWFISEYIKFKNYKYQIKFYDEKKNRLQQKFNLRKSKTYENKRSLRNLYSLVSLYLSKIFKPKFIFDDIGLKFKDQCSLNFYYKQLPYKWDHFFIKKKYNQDLRQIFMKNLIFKMKRKNFII